MAAKTNQNQCPLVLVNIIKINQMDFVILVSRTDSITLAY